MLGFGTGKMKRKIRGIEPDRRLAKVGGTQRRKEKRLERTYLQENDILKNRIAVDQETIRELETSNECYIKFIATLRLEASSLVKRAKELKVACTLYKQQRDQVRNTILALDAIDCSACTAAIKDLQQLLL